MLKRWRADKVRMRRMMMAMMMRIWKRMSITPNLGACPLAQTDTFFPVLHSH